MSRTKCSWCGKSGGKMSWYIIADDMERPRPYHPKCYNEMFDELLVKIFCDVEKKK